MEFPCLRRITWNSTEIRKFRGNGKIPRLGSKFCGSRKTVGPTHHFLIHDWLVMEWDIQLHLLCCLNRNSNYCCYCSRPHGSSVWMDTEVSNVLLVARTRNDKCLAVQSIVIVWSPNSDVTCPRTDADIATTASTCSRNFTSPLQPSDVRVTCEMPLSGTVLDTPNITLVRYDKYTSAI